MSSFILHCVVSFRMTSVYYVLPTMINNSYYSNQWMIFVLIWLRVYLTNNVNLPTKLFQSINNIESTLYTSLWCVLCTLGNTITGKLILKMDFPGLPYSMKSLYFHLLFHSWWDNFCYQTKVGPPQITMDKNMGKSQSNTDQKNSVFDIRRSLSCVW